MDAFLGLIKGHGSKEQVKRDGKKHYAQELNQEPFIPFDEGHGPCPPLLNVCVCVCVCVYGDKIHIPSLIEEG